MTKTSIACVAGLLSGGTLLGCSAINQASKDDGGLVTETIGTGGSLGTGGTGLGSGGHAGASTRDAGTGSDSAVTGAPEDRNLSCLAILSCAADCTDSPCEDACLARGNQDAQSEAVALAQCATDNDCQDVPCLQGLCGTTLRACAAPPNQTMGTPIGVGGPPSGSIPPQMIGNWQYVNAFGSLDSFTFGADGTLTRKLFLTGGLVGCNNTTAIQDEGTAVFNTAADAFTFYVATSTVNTNTCGVLAIVPGSTGAFEFSVEPTQYMNNPIRIYELATCKYPVGDPNREFDCSKVYYLK